MPPSDDRRDSPALRQEGPQQELPNVTKRLEHLTVQLKGWCDCGGEGCNLCCGARTAVDAAMEIVKLRAALSASRTAQAPQQEGVDLAARVQSYLGHGGFFNPELMAHDKVRDLVMDLQARIQVLETSVDYLRYLVDHPVAPAEGEQ